MSEEKFRAKKGLEGVIFDTTAIAKAMPDKKALIYRGYAVPELATNCSFEEVSYLLLQGDLPNAEQLSQFSAKEKSAREIDTELIKAIALFPKGHHPMDAVRTGVSFLGLQKEFIDVADDIEKAINLIAKTPTIVATGYRFRQGLERIPPRTDLSSSENFFHMCFGKVPDAEVVQAFDGSLTLYAEHGFNASTFTARVVVSSLSDMVSGVTAAIGSLKGPLHGGANEAVMHMLKEIGTPEAAKPWPMEALKAKKKVMGFGHRLYRIGDSQVPTMQTFRDKLSERTGETKWQEISKILEETMIAEKNIYPNLDFPAGPVFYLMGFDINVFTPIFVMARMSGWTAHIIEQLSDNRLVRPNSDYIGPLERKIVELRARK